MRLFLVLAPLAMLLLNACTPAGGSSTTGNGTKSDPGDQSPDSLESNRVSNAEMAAMDSLGKPPLPRNLITSVENSCPVHHRKMKIAEIPITFEDDEGAVQSTDGLATEEFPFGAARILSAGNALLPSEPRTAQVYQCPNCMAYRKAADEKRKLSAQSPQLTESAPGPVR